MKNRKFFLNLLAFRKADPPEGLRKQGSALLTRGAPSFLKRTLATSLAVSMIAGFAPGFAVEAHAATKQTIQGGGIDGKTLYTWDRNLTNVVEAPFDKADTVMSYVDHWDASFLGGLPVAQKRIVIDGRNKQYLAGKPCKCGHIGNHYYAADILGGHYYNPDGQLVFKTPAVILTSPFVRNFTRYTGSAEANSLEYKNVQLTDSSIVYIKGNQKYVTFDTQSVVGSYLDNTAAYYACTRSYDNAPFNIKFFTSSPLDGKTIHKTGTDSLDSAMGYLDYRKFETGECPVCHTEYQWLPPYSEYSNVDYLRYDTIYSSNPSNKFTRYNYDLTIKEGDGVFFNEDYTRLSGTAFTAVSNLSSLDSIPVVENGGYVDIDTSVPLRTPTQATLVIPEGETVVLNNCTVNADVIVEPGATLKLFNCSIASDGRGAGTQYEKQKYSQYSAASKDYAVTNLGGTIICYSVDITGPASSSSFMMGEKTELTTNESNHLVYSSEYTSWDEIEGGNSGGSVGDITVEMGDMSAPMITVERTPNSSATPTNEVSFTVTAVDPQGNNSEKPISIDGGEWQKSPCEFTVNENRTVTVWATDSEGNVREVNINVSNIDTENPEIVSLSANRTTYTSGNVRLTAQASDDQKLADQPYYWSFDPINANGQTLTETASASKYFTATENGEVALRVKDAMGKFSEEETYTVSIIDHTPPTIAGYTVTPSANANVQDGVLIHVNVEDTADATGDTSGLPTNFVSWDGVWGKEDLRVYENGTYQVKVRDSVGNVSKVTDIPIDFIKTKGPYIGSIKRDKNASYITSPLKITVNGFDSDGTALEGRAYSWDGGNSWTSLKTKTVTENGEYIVTVRDAAGNTAEESVIVDNIDSFKPTVELRLAREIRTDETTGREKSYWVLKVEAADIGSGINYIEADWDGSTTYDAYKQSDVTAAGVYGVKVYDLAGNSTYEYITITNEMLGISGSGSISGGASTPIIIDTGAVGDTSLTAGGLVSEFANPSNVIYGENGVYNKVTKNYSTYDDANYPRAGIALTASITPLKGSYVTGSLELEGVTYDMVFGGWRASETGQWEADLAYGFIPWSAITSDLKNKRMKVQVFEWEDASKTTLVREGSAVIYVSAQVTDPVIRYTYNKVNGEITIVPTSTVAGIASTKYAVNAGAAQDYTVPFTYVDGSRVKIDVSDNVRQTASITLDSSTLELEGGTGSLPTEGLPSSSSLTSYRFSTRTSESYLINGSSSNTDVVPSGGVFSSILS